MLDPTSAALRTAQRHHNSPPRPCALFTPVHRRWAMRRARPASVSQSPEHLPRMRFTRFRCRRRPRRRGLHLRRRRRRPRRRSRASARGGRPSRRRNPWRDFSHGTRVETIAILVKEPQCATKLFHAHPDFTLQLAISTFSANARSNPTTAAALWYSECLALAAVGRGPSRASNDHAAARFLFRRRDCGGGLRVPRGALD